MFVPTFCPICQMTMRGTKSEESFFRCGACDCCEIEFVEGREERWATGWRPDPEAVARMVVRLSASHNEAETGVRT